MTQPRVAIQGNPGSYAHVAARALRPEAAVEFYPTFEEAVRAAEEGAVAEAIIPIENSSMGRIADIHALLPSTHLHITAEYYLPVQHCLLALPGTPMAQLRTAHSQLPALVQCKETLQRLGLQPVATADTALAAKAVAEQADPSQAAVASHLAGELYGLAVVQTPLNDHAHNTTRFVVLAHPLVQPNPAVPCKLSLLFRMRDQAGALYAALRGFAEQGVNLTKLESYIDTQAGDFSLAEFYAELEGHPAQPAVAKALQQLKNATAWVRLMGVYPRHQPDAHEAASG